eukprot:4324363-Prymnesium_polylepis.1
MHKLLDVCRAQAERAENDAQQLQDAKDATERALERHGPMSPRWPTAALVLASARAELTETSEGSSASCTRSPT